MFVDKVSFRNCNHYVMSASERSYASFSQTPLPQSPTKRYITGALSVSKYELPSNRIIIVIGEEHSLDLSKCTRYPQIHVSDYVKEFMSTRNATLLMEYPPEKNLATIQYQSANMRELRDAIVAMKQSNKTFGIDTRRSHINSDLLYGPKVYDLTYGDLLRLFWEPLLKEDILRLPSASEYRKEDYEFLKSYVQSKRGNIRWFYENIVKRLDLKRTVRDAKVIVHSDVDVVEFLRKIWADVSDFRILELVLKDPNRTFIIVVGYKHAENIRDIFRKFEVFHYWADDKYRCIDISKA